MRTSPRSSARPLRTVLIVSSLAVLVGATGCGNRSGRLGVEGEVTFDGVPIEEGKISFIPLPGTASPTAGATIRDGYFQVPEQKGLKPGEFQVSIKAIRPTGTQVFNEEAGGMIDEMALYIPDRYNTNTELRATITADKNNALRYELTGD